MMSADRSVNVGAALLVVGVAAVLARLSYVWTSGGHFWDVWFVVGVVVAGLGGLSKTLFEEVEPYCGTE